MSRQSHAGMKLFTVDEANAMLPLVRAITGDIVKLSREIVDRRQRLAFLTAGRDLEGEDPYSAELAEIQRQLDRDVSQLQTYVDELVALAVEPKGGPEGLVDFPCWMDGRVVCLCWRYDEPEIAHWHEVDAGFAGRQPLSLQGCSPTTECPDNPG
ncbi:MAG: DUF2203 family protein [Planctomycetes bacterium]|nr:DUF2203 family protein [Planctomycetota bacterium]